MRTIYLLLTIIILASCGNQKIRYVRVKQAPKAEIIALHAKKHDGSTLNTTSDAPTTNTAPIEIVKPTEPSEKPVENELESAEFPIIYKAVPEDSTVIIDRTTFDNKADIALRAERNADISLGLLIGALVGYLLFLFVGIILFIIGASFYRKANNAEYITEDGLNTLSIAKIFLIMDAVFLVLAAVLIIFILLLFL